MEKEKHQSAMYLLNLRTLTYMMQNTGGITFKKLASPIDHPTFDNEHEKNQTLKYLLISLPSAASNLHPVSE